MTLQNYAMNSNSDTTPAALATLDDAPRYYANLIAQTFKQPLIPKPKHTWGVPQKILPLESYDDCRICNLLCSCAEETIPGYRSDWYVYENPIYREGNDLKSGVILSLYTNNYQIRSKDLEEIYTHLITTLQNGWSVSTSDLNPDIYGKKFEEEWNFFIKKQTHLKEDALIRSLACRFKLDEKNEM